METSLIGKALDFGPREYGFEPRVSKLSLQMYLHTLLVIIILLRHEIDLK